jgi:hypothetical protein
VLDGTPRTRMATTRDAGLAAERIG